MSEKIIMISTAQELSEFALKVNSGEDFTDTTVCLGADIDLSVYADDGGWTPIGSDEHPFCGLFDGGEKIISGIFIKRPGGCNQGLFGINNGRIKNLIIKDSNILGDSYIGAVAGCGDGVIERCDCIGNHIEGRMYVGGIIGKNGDETTDCTNISDVTGEEGFIGGIAGMNPYGSSIINCINTGKISGGRDTGGITGSHNEQLERCFNTGNVTGSEFYVGGIAGSCGDTSINDCYNTGHIAGEGAVGGIAGSCQHSTIDGCYNAGKVEGGEDVGAITGVDDVMIGHSYTDKEKCLDKNPDVINLFTQEMTANDVLSASMSGLGDSWCKRTNDVHSYYPELSVFRDDPKRTELSKESVKAISSPNYVLDRIIVKYKAPRATGGSDMFNPQAGYQVNGISVKQSRIINPSPEKELDGVVLIANKANQNTLEVVELAEAGEEAVARAIESFEAMENVEYAEKCFLLKHLDTPSIAPEVSDICCPYGLKKISAPKAWEITRGNESIVVGIIDTGVDIRHPAIKDKLWVNPNVGSAGYEDDLHGYDFIHRMGYNGRNAVSDDPTGHGTHIAGTIAGGMFGPCSGCGVAPDVKIAVIKVSHLDEGDTSTAIEGINYANNMGILITNNSYYSLNGESRALRETIENGGLFIACAGNTGTDIDKIPTYPASYDCKNIITVAASDHNDELTDFSNYGETAVDLAAPGYQICSLLPYLDSSFGQTPPDYAFRYVSMSGTSMATPHVAGAAALVMSAFLSDANKMSMVDLIMATKNRLIENVDKLEGLAGKVRTGGRLNVYKAIKPE